jgi:hypothetical protein
MIIDIIIYIIVIFLVIKAYKSEALDLFCGKDVKSYCKNLCGDNKGKYYVDGQGDKDDSIPTLLSKIEINASADDNTVKWRRSLLLAFICTMLIFIVVLTKLPTGTELITTVLIIFIITYFSFSFYQYHYYRYPTFNIHKNVNLLRQKLDLEYPDLKIII